MKKNKKPTEYQIPPIAAPTYQTGSTNPPKSYAGFVSVLLGAVIFLCSISTILSLMRINMLQWRARQAESRACSFSFAACPDARAAAYAKDGPAFQGQALDGFWQDYSALPQGVYITYAPENHVLLPGDVLVTVDGHPVASWDALLQILSSYQPGQTVPITVYRQGSQLQISLTVGQ